MEIINGRDTSHIVNRLAGQQSSPRCDEYHLMQLDQKLQLVRDRTAGVALGNSTGFYLHGNGGIGKSYTVLSELERLQVSFKLFNSHITFPK